MKKILLTVSILVLVISFTFGQSISVTSPKAGEYTQNENIRIAWKAIGIIGVVNIKLCRSDNSLIIFLKKNFPITGPAFNYPLSGVNPGNYYVRIEHAALTARSPEFKVIRPANDPPQTPELSLTPDNKPVIKKKVTKFYKKPTTFYKKPKPITVKKSTHAANLQIKVVDLACSLKVPTLLPGNNKVKLRAGVFVLESGGKKLTGKLVTFLFTMKNERNSVIRSKSVTLRIQKFPTPTIGEVHIPIEDLIAKHPIHVKVELDPGDKFMDKDRSNNTKSKTFWLK